MAFSVFMGNEQLSQLTKMNGIGYDRKAERAGGKGKGLMKRLEIMLNQSFCFRAFMP